MKLSAYLSPSRHGVYYFRWPLPQAEEQKRRTVRISLRTKCPDRAGDLARHLASCGRLIRENKTLARLRQDEMRDIVRSYFAASLDRYVERLNDTGLPERSLDALRQELDVHEDAIGGFDDLSDLYLDTGTLDSFRASAGLTEAQWAENEPALRQEMRKARRDQIKAILSAAESLEGYSFTKPCQTAPRPPQARSASLGEAIEDFMAEPQWSDHMAAKARAFLSVLLEYFGPDRRMADITRHDAAEVKKVVQSLPINRKTKTETKDLPLLEAIEVPGMKKVSVETVNNHMAMFYRFWKWAVTHGKATEKLFEEMKITARKKPDDGRKAFSPAQTKRLFQELTENTSGFVKEDDHKWGALLGLYTGARLREIAQLDVTDIRQEGDIWFIDINDDGPNKSLKTPAAKRRVPVHSDLIQLGFLDWVAAKPEGQRLFLSFSYNAKEGYGRNLGRRFNNVLLPGLGMKEGGLVFHSLRHTMVTRLAQAGVPEPLFQEIVGHERQGVAQQVYFKEGHTLVQKQEALEKFKV
ncbi:integrase [Roseobacter denitrificans]|uniref:Site-specific recombinase, phage integrase family n=2 Tax=Roseobacter denitrificans TaxID=2434 RepID=Q164L3_ROSDO|nr:site-specific recombinase, phage integrase family [Roseobacter denitrificans OCh 114]AVL54780.1 integrase [Roseobacter denitrificans]SFF92500.1 Phage integrase family protein [Roseobacter denitrificans OCh 114]